MPKFPKAKITDKFMAQNNKTSYCRRDIDPHSRGRGIRFVSPHAESGDIHLYASGFATSPVNSLNELQARLAVPLDYPSPVGQEELVRNTANNILGFVSQGADPTSTAVLVSFLTNYYTPIIARGRGMSFGQDLYLMGAIEEMAYAHTGNPAYLAASQKYYEEGVALGPNRPQSLYGLFDVYRAEGNMASTTAIGEKILSNWPTDTSIAGSFRLS